MAEPDCVVCELLGYRSCDHCGAPAWEPDNLFRHTLGFEWCAECSDTHRPRRVCQCPAFTND